MQHKVQQLDGKSAEVMKEKKGKNIFKCKNCGELHCWRYNISQSTYVVSIGRVLGLVHSLALRFMIRIVETSI